MMLIIGGALLVLFIWFVAYFSPSGKKLGAVNTQTQTALTQQAQLNDQLARLRTYSNETGTLIQLSDRLSAALPPTTDIYNYITSLSQAATTAGVSIESVSPNTPTADGGVSVIGVSINTRGSYDQTLAFIKALNALPRLTVITGLQISGGGTGSTRGTELITAFSTDIFSLASATPASTGG